MATQTVGLFEAKTHLSELVARAEGGEEVIITRHNKPVARLVPIDGGASAGVAGGVSPELLERRLRSLATLQSIGQTIAAHGGPVSREEILEWVHEGRK